MKQHISHNGREECWRALMTACDQRPAGQSITDWLEGQRHLQTNLLPLAAPL